jgi:hypothetical protein
MALFQWEQTMDEKDLHDRGLKLRIDMFGRDAVEKRMNAFGEFGKPLQHIINAYAYGNVWSRSALPPATKSIAMLAMMAAARHPNELTAKPSVLKPAALPSPGFPRNGVFVSPFSYCLLLVAAFSNAEELSFYGTPRNDSRRCLESTSNTLGRSHR